MKAVLFAAASAAVMVASHGDHDHHHDHDGHDHAGHSHEKPVVAAATTAKHPVIPQTLLDRIDFLETFQDGPQVLGSKWLQSKHPRYSEQEWSVDSTFGADAGFADEQSLGVMKKHKHYGLIQKFGFGAFDNTNQDMVFQYEVRFHSGNVGCSGAYVKLLRKFEGELTEQSPYVVMFGPDKCGSTNKVHLIIQQKQPSLGTFEEKHMTSVVLAKATDNLSHLYTLVIRKDNTFSVLVDQQEMASGNLLTPSAFEPSFGGAKEMDDPEDRKPADWVEEAKIVDPTAQKPEDWDEDAPKTIQDPDAQKPADWNDEDDGEWEPSHIPNPNYRGKWKAPMIDNPEYKGEWKPRRIPNPHHFVDETPSNLEPIEAVAFEVLVNDGGIAFDNLLLSHDESAAREFAELTFKPKQQLEIAAAEAAKRYKSKQARLKALEEDGAVGLMRYWYGEAWDFITTNYTTILYVLPAIILVFTTFVCWKMDDPNKPPVAARVAVKEEEEEEEEEEEQEVVDKKKKEEEDEEGTKATQ